MGCPLGRRDFSRTGSFGAVIEILVRTRAEYETFTRTSDAFEASVASAFAEVVASHDSGDGEVVRVAEAMLSGAWVTTNDVEQLAVRMEEVTAVAIAAIREHDTGAARRQALGSELQAAAVGLKNLGRGVR